MKTQKESKTQPKLPGWWKSDSDIIPSMGDQQLWGWRVQYLDNPFPILTIKPSQLAVDINVLCYNWMKILIQMEREQKKLLYLESTSAQHLSYGNS